MTKEIDDEIILLEYAQSAEDWRHRDSMLWQTLSFVIILTTAAFAFSFSPDKPLSGKVIVLFFAALLATLSLIKITKDRHYQRGSAEYSKHLINVMSEKNIVNIVQLPDDQKSLNSFNPRQPVMKIESTELPFYPFLTRIPAFRFFYYTNLLLIILTTSFCIYDFLKLII
jgi:hypothetical protein